VKRAVILGVARKLFGKFGGTLAVICSGGGDAVLVEV
jgi:hypothetical protein